MTVEVRSPPPCKCIHFTSTHVSNVICIKRSCSHTDHVAKMIPLFIIRKQNHIFFETLIHSQNSTCQIFDILPPVIFKVILAVMYFSGLSACLLSVTRALDCWEFCSNDRVVKSVSSTHFIAEEWKHVLTLLHIQSSAETLELLLQDEIVWIGIKLTLEIFFLTGHRVDKEVAKKFYGGKGGITKLFP